MTADGFKPPSYYTPRRGPSLLLIAVIAGVVTVVVGVLLAWTLKLGPFAAAPAASATPTVAATPAVSAASSTLQTEQPTTEPSAGATAAPTDSATAAPTDSPSASQPPATPGDALDRLLVHVPEDIRASCVPGTSAAPVTALVSCTSADGIAVDYALYEDIIGMYDEYDRIVGRAQIEPDSGTCYDQNSDGTLTATTDSWPSERIYSIADEPIGRYLCEPSGQGSITWTDDRFDILSVATAPAGDLNRLVTFWVNEAGPVL